MAIAAHPDRARMAHRLAGRLDREPRIVWDTGNDEWATHARAWTAHNPGATHHLVLQDDAVPCRDLIQGTERLLPDLPAGMAMSLYLGTHRNYKGPDPRHHAVKQAARLADIRGVARVLIPGVWWGVAVILATADIPAMLAFCENRREVYDLRLTRWHQHTKRWVAYPYPCLVDHADTDSIVKPGRESGRVAIRHIGPNTSALDANTTGPELWLYPTGPAVWPPQKWDVRDRADPGSSFPRPAAGQAAGGTA